MLELLTLDFASHASPFVTVADDAVSVAAWDTAWNGSPIFLYQASPEIYRANIDVIFFGAG